MAIPPDNEAVRPWDEYVTQNWAKWARKAAISRTIKPFYQKLFAAHEQLQGRDDAYDLYIGTGLIDSRTDSTQRLHRHVFAFPAELVLDEKSGALSVGPSADFVTLKAELDFFPPTDRARLQPQLDGMSGEFGEVGPALHNRLAVGGLLKQLVHSLDEASEYIDDLSPQDAQPGRMRASFAPALILRPKSTRSLDELLARIQADASGANPRVTAEEMPTAWRRMMEDGRVWSGEAGTAGGQTNDGAWEPDATPEDFPMESQPANGEPDEGEDRPESPQAGEDEPEQTESEAEQSELQGTLDFADTTEERTGPFTGYGGKHYPDPRTAPISNVREGVLDIVATDGPLPKESLYRLYREGCPRVERAGKNLRQAVNRAVYSLERASLVMSRDEGTRRRPSEVVVKLPLQQWVEWRPPGSRRLEDIPPSELGLSMYNASDGIQPESEDERTRLYREVAGCFGVRRLTPLVVQRLGLAERIADSSEAGDRTKLF